MDITTETILIATSMANVWGNYIEGKEYKIDSCFGNYCVFVTDEDGESIAIRTHNIELFFTIKPTTDAN
jgi:hypothetical protein